MADPFLFEPDFGDDPPPPPPPNTRPPWRWLLLSLAAAIIGGTLAWVTGSLALAVLGWVIAGPGGLTLLAWFRNRDQRARISGVYLAPTWAPAAYWATLGCCLAAIIASALRVAIGVGRM